MNEARVPERISWKASDTSATESQPAKAMMLAFWDSREKTAMRIDLWTQDMMVDEMTDFFYQTFITMADTYQRATHQEELATEIKTFARQFYEHFRETQRDQKKV